MLIVRVDRGRPDRRLLGRVAEIVRRGGLVVYPTDTVYGLGGDPLREDVVERIYAVKRRDRSKPVPVLVASVEDAKRIAVFDYRAERLAEKYWPGPLTLVLRAKQVLPCIVTSCTGRVAVRMPGDRVALALIELSGGLLVGTSANISGNPSPRTAMEAVEQLGERVDAVVDAGPSPLGVPSTVLDLTGRVPRIVRKGPIGLEEILEALRWSGEES